FRVLEDHGRRRGAPGPGRARGPRPPHRGRAQSRLDAGPRQLRPRGGTGDGPVRGAGRRRRLPPRGPAAHGQLPDRPPDRRAPPEPQADRGEPHRGPPRNPLVLGIPRGGVVMADLVARQLGGEFGVALVRKLRAPGRPDLAIGSVAETGQIFLNDDWEERLPDNYLKSEAADALSHLRER